jgi:uncharacterized membrane protein
MDIWAHAAPSVVAAFLGSLVEFVEALTIVLAVGTVRGWHPALFGALSGGAVLVGSVILLGPVLLSVEIRLVQLVVGVALLLFGMRWLRKAILRSAGIIPLHDEAAAYAAETTQLRAAGPVERLLLDPIAIATTFKAVVLEGVEVVFIVVAAGAASNALLPASIGAVLAAILVLVLGLILHRPLARVPENTLKFGVGILISAYGVFWVGEGLGFGWPGEDLAIVMLAAAFLVAALAASRLASHIARPVTVGDLA